MHLHTSKLGTAIVLQGKQSGRRGSCYSNRCCFLCLQLMKTSAGWISKATLQPRVHVTPLRASRSLALRFLGHRFGVPMDRFVVVVPAPAVEEQGDSKILVRCCIPQPSG